jgi:hypothetical protein
MVAAAQSTIHVFQALQTVVDKLKLLANGGNMHA